MNQLNNKRIILVGSGGHAKVVFNTLVVNNFEVDEIFDPKVNNYTLFSGITKRTDDNLLFTYDPLKCNLYLGIGDNPPKKRKDFFSLAQDKGFEFPPLFHPRAIISDDLSFADGLQVMAGSVIQPNCSIGKNSIINTSSIIEHDVTIGNNCHVAPGVTICGNVKVGDDVFIGAGTTICPNVQISDGTFIKAHQLIK